VTGGGRGRLITSVVGVAALLGPLFGDDIIGMIVTCNEIAVGAVFLPILGAVFTKRERLPKEAAWGAFLLGTAGTIVGWLLHSEAFHALLPLVFSGLGYCGGFLIAKSVSYMDQKALAE
jgi:hypothetical protein